MADAVVTVLTYQRNESLAALLPELARQADLAPLATRVLVVDNDPAGGARDVVVRLDAKNVEYVHEPEPGIAAARNRALGEARDERFLVFIDDDEHPTECWLDNLLKMALSTGAAAIVGPVESTFDLPLDEWVSAGGFFQRRRPPTGTRITVAATNNLLLDMNEIRRLGLSFDSTFGLSGGSDTLFTRRLAASGATMLWCAEALVYDRVPPHRATRAWVLHRAFRSGNSWSRTSIALAGSRWDRIAVRLRLSAEGAVRALAGYLAYLVGLALRRRGLSARGLRRGTRGAGMVAGTVGHVYVEYGRAAPRVE